MKKFLVALALILGINPALAVDNYSATAGAGLTFAAKDNGSGVLFSRFIGCDNTTTTQCWVIDASGRISVSITSGSVASGAFAAGALAAGAGVDGWDLTQGTKNDTAYLGSGSASVISILKGQYNAITGSQAAGSNTIGKVNRDYTSDIGFSAMTSGVAEGTHVLKASAGSLHALTTTIGATTGWVMIFDATSAPADGPVTPKFCRYIKSDGTGGSNSVQFAPPLVMGTGISVAFSSTGCFTKTASSTAFFSGQVQ